MARGFVLLSLDCSDRRAVVGRQGRSGVESSWVGRKKERKKEENRRDTPPSFLATENSESLVLVDADDETQAIIIRNTYDSA